MVRQTSEFLTDNLFVYTKKDAFKKLAASILKYKPANNKFFFLTDSNTSRNCLPLIKINFKDFIEIKIPAGEQHKTISTCSYIWHQLLKHRANRHSVLVNLGGGVVCDIGGFAASCFKRGIKYINIPTTLLAMTDAGIGGKTGVNFSGYKNQVGLYSPAEAVFIIPQFLKTLDRRNYKNGLAEIYKHALISDGSLLGSLRNKVSIEKIIYRSIKIKSAIVNKDFYEKRERKILNFGHTIGHAIEAAFNPSRKTSVLHGEAVAAGMIMELYLSHVILKFPQKDLINLTVQIKNNLNLPKLQLKKQDKYLMALEADKKNHNSNINFTLLRKIGQPVINCTASIHQIMAALRFYLKQIN